jgi:hypothetical protein
MPAVVVPDVVAGVPAFAGVAVEAGALVTGAPVLARAAEPLLPAVPAGCDVVLRGCVGAAIALES